MIFAERVRQAREFRGLTQSELAGRAQLSQPAIAHLETGRTYVPSDNTIRLLSLQLGFPRNFFQMPPGPEFPEGSMLYRARRSATAREKAQSHRYGELIFQLVFELSKSVSLPGPVRIPRFGALEAEQAARLTRSALRLGPDLPITNLVNVLERNGVLLIALPRTATFVRLDAFSAWTTLQERQPVIVIASHSPGERQQFSVAHEVGHLVLHDPPRGSIQDMEREADAFAAELLLPAATIRSELKRPINLGRLLELKRRWHVSVQALAHRARELEMVTHGEYRYLMQQISAQGWKKAEPGSFPPTKPRAVRKMFELAYGDPIDVRAVAALHRLSSSTLADILDAHASKHELLSGGRVGLQNEAKLVQLRPQSVTSG